MRTMAATLSILALLVLCLAEPLIAAPVPSDFKAVVERALQGDQTVDFTLLRQQNAERSHYFPLHWAGRDEAMGQIHDKPESALRLANDQLKNDPLDIFANLVAEAALRKLERPDESARHHALISGILNSVRGGKDGQSQEAAWNAISVPEEYAVLFLMGLEPQGQAQINKDGHSFDRMSVKDEETGQETAIWFNIDFFFGKELE